MTPTATCEGDADLATVGARLADRARASVLLALAARIAPARPIASLRVTATGRARFAERLGIDTDHL